MCIPKVSVIIPSYNNSFLLSEMIECIVKQTLDSWELIIVDDNSTDNTQQIVESYIKQDSRIKLIIRNREPKGSATCRNIGFNDSIGKYVIHFDADDLISSTCLEKRVLFMDNNPEIDYASFPAKVFVDKTMLTHYSNKGRLYGIERKKKDLLTCFLIADYPFSTWNNIYRKDSIYSYSWDEKVKIYTDFSFIIPCILHGLKHKFSNSKEIDYYYRQQGNSQNMCSSFVSQEKCDSTIYLFKKTLEEIKLRSDYNKRKKEFSIFIVLHYERLIIDGEKQNVSEYLDFCRAYYNFLSFTLFLISKTLLPVKNKVIKKLLLYIQIYIFFYRKQSILNFIKTLIHWK